MLNSFKATLFILLSLPLLSNSQDTIYYDDVVNRISGYGYSEYKIPHSFYEDTVGYFVITDSLKPSEQLQIDFDLKQLTNNVWASWLYVFDTALTPHIYYVWVHDTYWVDYNHTSFGLDSHQEWDTIMIRNALEYQLLYIVPELWVGHGFE